MPIRDLVYGVSGAGKTSWWIQVARYLHERTGKKTRWYLGDGGIGTLEVNDVDGFIEIMAYNQWDHPLETSQKICEGYWPRDPLTPNSPLVRPSAEELSCYGLFVYEGLTVMADYIMGHRQGGLAYRMARGEMLNNDPSYRIKDGELLFGGNARTHYGFAQRLIIDLIERTRGLPVHVGWTAHERKVEDQDYREVWIGPDVAGQMLTTKIGASFTNTIHLHVVRGTRKIKDPVTGKTIEQLMADRRAYTRTHFDPEGQHFVKYFANTRVPLGREFPEYIPPDPIEYYRQLNRREFQ